MASIGGAAKSRARRLGVLLVAGMISPLILLAAGGGAAQAGQLTAGDFTAYNPANAATIQAGPFALFTVNVDSLHPTQEDEGLAEVDKKAAGFDLDSPGAGLTNDLLTDIEPVVIGPGGQLYLTDGHHTFTALLDSTFGASNPIVYVNVIANFSSMTPAQFFAAMQAGNLLMPLNDGVPQTVNPQTGAPIPTTLTSLNPDPYRGLEYSLLKNKNSKLFPTTANTAGVVGSSTPGLDKMTGAYTDFLEADAYRNANGGLGLPYLSPGDINYATAWNLDELAPAQETTTLPGVTGAVTPIRLPGFILSQNITNTGGISNATLATGALDGAGGFTGVTSINAGTAASPIFIGTPNTGFIMQLGNDNGDSVTLQGTNTYTGGTSILAGHLIVQSDASLGAAAPNNPTINPAAILSSVQAANGIVFNSLTEGNGTLTLGTSSGGSFSTNRVIAVDSEVATLDANDNTVTLTGQIVSLGTNGVGLGNATGESDLTFDDLSGAGTGKFILSTPSPLFFGNIIIGNTGTPTVEVMSDAALGNTTGPAVSIGTVELNGGTLQLGASFNAPERNINLAGGSQIDVNGFTSTWGNVSDTQRTLEVLNSNATTAGAITFNSLTISATATLQLAGGAAGESVTFTNGISRTANDTLILDGSTATSLGASEQVFSSGASTALINGVAPAWIVTDDGTGGKGPYDFVTYSAASGYSAATYNANTTALNGTTGAEVVKLTKGVTLSGASSVFALNANGQTITEAGDTLTLGDGTHPAGLIMPSKSSITGGALAFGGSEGVIWMSGTSSIGSTITGTNGLTFAGSGTLNLGAPGAEGVTGPLTIDSGTVNFTSANLFTGDSLLMADVKKHPAPSTLGVSANNELASLDTVSTHATINLSNGAALTLGDTTNNLSSTISGAITETGAATAGAITLNGSGLFDFSGGGSKAFGLVSGGSIVVNNSAVLRAAANEFIAGTTIVLNGTSQLQLAENGGQQLIDNVTGTGELHLIGGTLQILSTANTYSGGTVVETGSTLDITTSSLPAASPNITDAGGLIVFDQATTGTYAGVISDGREMGTGPMLSGSLDKDDSTGANGGDLILSQAQAYSGETFIEAGEITLNAANTLATSSGVDLGRVGGGATATLALGANNALQALSSETGNTTSVLVGANTLTINSPASGMAVFGGSVSGAGALVMSGAGVQDFTGAVGLGSASVTEGQLVVGGGTFATTTTTVSGGLLNLAGGASTTGTLTMTGGMLEVDGGTLTAGTTDVNGGVLDLVSAGGFTSTAVNIGAGGVFMAPGGAATSVAAVFNNAGVLDLRNGAANNVFTVGAYTGSPGSQVDLGVDFTTRTADRLVATSVAGSSQIVVTDQAPATPAPFNPTGIPVVVSAGALSLTNFSLAGGPIQKGLFEYDLALDPDPQLVLIGVPNADAFRLTTLPSASQSIWFATADVWSDHQADLRQQAAAGAPAATVPVVWARVFGDWENRTQTQSYSNLGNTYAFQTGYSLNTGGLFAGVDLAHTGVFAKDDSILVGIGGGYLSANQGFKGSTTGADYDGGSLDLSAAYLSHGFFADVAFKADFLGLNYNDPSLAGFGTSRVQPRDTSYGVIADAGYRIGLGGGFIEPIATLGYVNSSIASVTLAGSQVSFGDNEILRGRIGASGGTDLAQTDDYKVGLTLSASYWGRLSGGSSATINSGDGAPLLTLTDREVADYGEAALSVTAISLKNGWSAFFAGDYQFSSGYDAAEARAGVRYAF